MGAGRGRTGGAGGGRGGGGASGGGSANGGGVSGGLGGTDLSSMNDNQLASFVNNAMQAQMPRHLNQDDPTQRLIYAAGWNDKPEVIAAARVEAMAKQPGAVSLYRTMSGNSGKTSKQVMDGLRNEDVFQSSGTKSTIDQRMYGGGAYFGTDFHDSKEYVARRGNTMGAVLNGRAKIIDADDLGGAVGANWIRQHPAAAKALGLMVNRRGVVKGIRGSSNIPGGYSDRHTMLAMAMGFNVVRNKSASRSSTTGASSDYYTILNRGVLTTSTKDYYSGNRGMK